MCGVYVGGVCVGRVYVSGACVWSLCGVYVGGIYVSGACVWSLCGVGFMWVELVWGGVCVGGVKKGRSQKISIYLCLL